MQAPLIGGRNITGSRICAAHGIAQTRNARDAYVIMVDVGIMAANYHENAILDQHRGGASSVADRQDPTVADRPSDRALI